MNQTKSWGDPVSEEIAETIEGSQGMKQAVAHAPLVATKQFGAEYEESEIVPTLGAKDAEHNAVSMIVEPVSATLGSRRGHDEQASYVTIPISGDALRGEGEAKTLSADAEGRERLRDPGLGIGDEGDPAYTIAAASPGAVAAHYYVEDFEDGTLTSSTGRTDRHPLLVEEVPEIAAPLSHGSNPNSNMAGRRREDDENLIVGSGIGVPSVPAIATRNEEPSFFTTQPDDAQGGQGAIKVTEIDTAPALDTVADARKSERGVRVVGGSSVRRLMPVECERLQALPDGWTAPTGKEADSRRYAALGDAVTASVAFWIGERIAHFAEEK